MVLRRLLLSIVAGHAVSHDNFPDVLILENPVHTHDLNATVLHLLGLDHERLTFRYQGRDFRLTDVHGELLGGIMA